MSCDYTTNSLIPLGSGYIRTLDNANPRSLKKIYCACGKIVDLDKKEMNLKLSLKKDLECITCRNARISRDIDSMNELFDENPLDGEDPLY